MNSIFSIFKLGLFFSIIMVTSTVSCAENITKPEKKNSTVKIHKSSLTIIEPSKMEKAMENDLISINVGQSVSIKYDLTITFVSVNDSRCPEGARCIHAGNGAVTLKLQKVGVEEQLFVVNTNLKAREISFQNFNVKIETLAPYPGSAEDVSSSVKRVTLLVSEKLVSE